MELIPDSVLSFLTRQEPLRHNQQQRIPEHVRWHLRGTVFKCHLRIRLDEEHPLQLHRGSDGNAPYAGLTFDQAGNLYGTTVSGGLYVRAWSLSCRLPDQAGRRASSTASPEATTALGPQRAHLRPVRQSLWRH